MQIWGPTWLTTAGIATTCTVLGIVYERRRHVFTQQQLAALHAAVEEATNNSGSGTPAVSHLHLDLAVAATLIGTLMFICGLFYLVNHSKDRIQEYAWSVISATTAIFTAVLSYSVLNFALRDLGFHSATLMAVDVAHFFAWYVLMNYAISRFSAELAHVAVKDTLHKEDVEAKVLCSSTLLAHITGFAAIGACLQIQSLDVFDGPLQFVFLLGLMAVLYSIFYVSDKIRDVEYESDSALASVDEECMEAENEAGAIVVSFMVFRAIRHCLLHEWDDHEAVKDIAEQDYKWPLKCLLSGGLLFMFGAVVHLPQIEAAPVNHTVKGGAKQALHLMVDPRTWSFPRMARHIRRWQTLTLNACTMSLAWFVLAAGQWVVSASFKKIGVLSTSNPGLQSACVAIVTTLLALLTILGLDRFEHEHEAPVAPVKKTRKEKGELKLESHQMHLLIQAIIKALAILIGFAWEQAFAGCTDVIAEASKYHGEWYPALVQVGLAGSVMLMVVPAWRFYTLKRVMELKTNNKKHK